MRKTEWQCRELPPGEEDALWPILEPIIREGATYPLAPDATQAEVLAYWTAPDKTVFVVPGSGGLVGTYTLRPNSTGPAAHVANAAYAVRPDTRMQGIGEAMARDSFVKARALGYLAMQYNLVVTTNRSAIALYRRLGMVEVGRLPKAFRHRDLGYVDALVMYRLL